LTPLGSGFNAWFPLLILLPVLFSIFSLYDKIKGVIGLGDLGGWIIEDDDDEDSGEIVSVVEGRGILKRELGLIGGGGGHIAARRTRPGRVLGTERPERVRPTYSDTTDDDDDGESFFVATGHRLWNSISNKVDDLRSSEDGDTAAEEEDRGLLGKISRPKWLQRGESGTSVWRLPKWGRGEDEGRVVL
jgi:hypothetical protein